MTLVTLTEYIMLDHVWLLASMRFGSSPSCRLPFCRSSLRSPAQVAVISHPPSVRTLLRVRKQLRGHSRITPLSQTLRI